MTGDESAILSADESVYFSRLRRDASGFLGGAGRAGGRLLYEEIERVVAQRLVRRNKLPAAHSEHARLLRPAGFGPDPFGPEAGWDLLHDFVVDYLFDPCEARILIAFQRAADLGGFRRWLRVLLSRYIASLIHDDEARGLLDSLVAGLGRRFEDRGLTHVGGERHVTEGRKPARDHHGRGRWSVIALLAFCL